ncbi:MAG: transcriptional repressor LexA [Candidatus Melainabacteria bacterium]|nr:transcriptional repressor LexA [Candidatus Melainabacteria bacterium]
MSSEQARPPFPKQTSPADRSADAPKAVDTLPTRQRIVLEAIMAFISEVGYPPSIQQLCQRCGVKSTSTIHYHVSALKKKGLIDWNPLEKRSISLHSSLKSRAESPLEPEPEKASIPLLGTIAAGSPLSVYQDSTEQIRLPEDLCSKGCYALRVKGVSMIEDHILDGDWVIVNPNAPIRDGDTVVALIEGQTTTLKRIYRESSRVRLQPANSEMEPIYATDVQVQGKVEAIIRKTWP